jgi:hypothetical protein
MTFLKCVGLEKLSWLPSSGHDKKADQGEETNPKEQRESSKPTVAVMADKSILLFTAGE